jgi:hypothetical protein
MSHAMKFAALALVLLAGNAMSAEEVKLPDWVPAFPDAKYDVVKNVKGEKNDKVDEVILTFSTKKSPAEVRDFYKAGFAKSGFAEDKMNPVSVNEPEEGVKQENLKADDGKRVWHVNARSDKVLTDTQVSLVYWTKK